MPLKVKVPLVALLVSFALLAAPFAAFAVQGALAEGGTYLTVQYVSHTQDEAVAWANQRNNENWGEDLDGNGLWCTDLVNAYCDYLGVSRLPGHAYAYNNIRFVMNEKILKSKYKVYRCGLRGSRSPSPDGSRRFRRNTASDDTRGDCCTTLSFSCALPSSMEA